MNKRTKLLIGIGLAVLLLAAVFAATAFAQGPDAAWGGWGRQGYGPGMMKGWGPGMMGGPGGMMGWWNRPVGPTALTIEQARAAGQGWLDANLSGTTLADDEVEFYGYYTIDFLKDDQPAGMLSVNAYTGQVWYHTWHGAFIGEKEF